MPEWNGGKGRESSQQTVKTLNLLENWLKLARTQLLLYKQQSLQHIQSDIISIIKPASPPISQLAARQHRFHLARDLNVEGQGQA
jgi:hypothetical protein